MKQIQIIIIFLLLNIFCYAQDTISKLSPKLSNHVDKIDIRNGFSGTRPYVWKLADSDLEQDYTFKLNFYCVASPQMWIQINGIGKASVGFYDYWNNKKQKKNKIFELNKTELTEFESILLDYHYMITDGSYHPLNCDTCPSITVTDGWRITGILNFNNKKQRDFEYSHFDLCNSKNQRLSHFILDLLVKNINDTEIIELIKEYRKTFNRQISWCKNNKG